MGELSTRAARRLRWIISPAQGLPSLGEQRARTILPMPGKDLRFAASWGSRAKPSSVSVRGADPHPSFLVVGGGVVYACIAE
jgi:hypothetical protein